jgi:transposase
MASGSLAGAEKKARQEGSIIVLSDEAGFYLLPGVVRTYAPRGQTPVLKPVLTYDHLAVRSGITRAGQRYTRVRDGALNSTDRVKFLKHLRHELNGKRMVIWDGSPIHRKEVRRFMADGGAKHIGLELLPAYAPDLNPAEGVWQQLKNVELRNVTCQNLPQLRLELARAIMRLRNKPHLVRSFFAEAGLSIET